MVFIKPAEGTITSGFRPPNRPNHHGIDIAQGGTVPIMAAAAGTVSRSYYSDSYGEVVFIEHNISGVRYETVYAHMRSGSRTVSVGQAVSVGQRLGYMGSTGDSTGQHLHFEVHRPSWNANKTNAVNPLDYIRNEDEEGPFRLLTGTFPDAAAQQRAATRLRNETGWTVYTVNDSGLRLMTGTFATRSSAERGRQRMIDSFGWTVYIID